MMTLFVGLFGLVLVSACFLLLLPYLFGFQKRRPELCDSFSFLFSQGVGGVGLVTSLSLFSFKVPMSLFEGRWIGSLMTYGVIALFFTLFILFVWLSYPSLQRQRGLVAPYFAFSLFCLLGMMLLISSSHLLVILMGLEILSLSLYVLVAFHKRDSLALEAAFKYFISGAIASALFLYGGSLIYGVSGSLDLSTLSTSHPVGSSSFLLKIGASFILSTFLFKIGMVPFGAWLPDVYEGASSPVTAWMGSAIKVACFVVLMRLAFFFSIPATHETLILLLKGGALLSLVVSGIFGLTQVRLKRFLAYSSMSHSSFMILGILASTKLQLGFKSVFFYLASYSILNCGLFFGISLMTSVQGAARKSFQDLQGLGSKKPFLAFCLSLFCLSLSGFPPFGGFWAKYWIFLDLIAAQEWLIFGLALLSSLFFLMGYLKIIWMMYAPRSAGLSFEFEKIPFWSKLGLGLTAAMTLALGLYPAMLSEVVQNFHMW